MPETKIINGIYRTPYAIYFVKDEKIMMKIKGCMYKTTQNFFQGNKEPAEPLTKAMLEEFDSIYDRVPNW